MPLTIPTLSRRELDRRYPDESFLAPAGGFNHGIVVVRDHDHPHGPFRIYRRLIKKVFRPQDVESGHAAREIAYLQQLNSSGTCASICKLIAFSHDKASGYGAMIMPYYSYGSLYNLLQMHRRSGTPIPRGFIWKVFLSLAEALVFMWYGPEPRQSDWNHILHRDIHPGNIFLSPTAAGQYPVVTLADFGCGIDNAKYAEDRAHGVGVLQSRFHQSYVSPEAPYSRSKSDIYQVGLVIVSLCKLTSEPRIGLSDSHPSGRHEETALNRLLEQCLKRNYSDRIGATTLRNELRSNVGHMKGGENRLLLA